MENIGWKHKMTIHSCKDINNYQMMVKQLQENKKHMKLVLILCCHGASDGQVMEDYYGVLGGVGIYVSPRFQVSLHDQCAIFCCGWGWGEGGRCWFCAQWTHFDLSTLMMTTLPFIYLILYIFLLLMY